MKEHLALHSERSWVIREEVNIFAWCGFDLRPINRDDSRVDYGLLLPKLFECLITKFREQRAQGIVAGASRDEPMQARLVKSSLGSKEITTNRQSATVCASDARGVALLAGFVTDFPSRYR